MIKVKLPNFLRYVTVLVSGSFLAQVILVAVQPLLSRIYSPKDVGGFALFSSVLSVVSVIATMRYEYAIMLPSENETERSKVLLGMTLLLTLVTCFAVLIGLGGAERWIFPLMGTFAPGKWIWLLPVSLLVVGWYQAFYFWGLRCKKFKTLSFVNFLRSASTAIVQVGNGEIGVHTIGLILGQLLGQFTAVCTLLMSERQWLKMVRFRSSWPIKLKQEAIRYRQFPLFSAPQTLINAVSQNIPVFLLGDFFSSTVVGYYALAYRLLQLPTNIVGDSIREVFYQQSSEVSKNKYSVYLMLKRTTLWLAIVGFIPFLILIFFGPQLFSIVLSNKWLPSGFYARILAIASYMSFINIPSVVLINIYNLQKFHMIYEIGLLIFRAASIITGCILHNVVVAIAFYASIGFIFNAFLISYVFYRSKFKGFHSEMSGVELFV